MNNVLEIMLSKYHPKNNLERENAIKEIIQEIALSGLSKGGFFEKAAFYGGTCLRIFHGLNRFSEDLDFALIEKDPNFKLDNYFVYLKKEFSSYGLDMDIEVKQKTNKDNLAVQNAFLKANTITLMMSFFPINEEINRLIPNQKTKIKFEIDTENPPGGNVETRYQMLPAPYEVKIFDESTLFAGKIHAIICRNYKHHVKGRDYYDYLFYIGKGAKINLKYLENKLKNTGKIGSNVSLTLEMVKDMLEDKFINVDYESAKNDVENFINNREILNIWSSSLFLSTLDKLEVK